MDYKKDLKDAIQHFKNAKHMSEVSYIFLRDVKIVGRVLDEIYFCFVLLIRCLLKYESFTNKIVLYKNSQMNFGVFKKKVAKEYVSEREFEILLKVLKMRNRRKMASMEFVRGKKFVVMDGDGYYFLTNEKMKIYLKIVDRILKNVIIKLRNI